jgi:hypothetical protein
MCSQQTVTLLMLWLEVAEAEETDDDRSSAQRFQRSPGTSALAAEIPVLKPLIGVENFLEQAAQNRCSQLDPANSPVLTLFSRR